MPKDSASEKRMNLKKELGGRGYHVNLSAKRQGANLVATLQVTEAATERSVAKLVTVAKVDDLNLVVGIDAPEGIVRDILSQAVGFADALRELVPAVTIRDE